MQRARARCVAAETERVAERFASEGSEPIIVSHPLVLSQALGWMDCVRRTPQNALI